MATRKVRRTITVTEIVTADAETEIRVDRARSRMAAHLQAEKSQNDK
jgi:hypothetical protein